MTSFTPSRRSRVHPYENNISGLYCRVPQAVRGNEANHIPDRTYGLSRRFGIKKGVTVIEPAAPAVRSPTTTNITSIENTSAEAWAQCATAMKEHEDAQIQAWKEEIDTELVFAALFSAILTAFDVEVYKMLQPQSNSTSQSSSSASSAVAINALWFSALICSVAAASISILVRQWLNQYTSGLTGVSPGIARLRQLRRDGLKKWKIAEIMMLLPILLQGAVVLFLIGLILFLKQLNTEIMKIASVLIALLLAFIFVTTILPTFKDNCSYQSPQAWGFFVIFQALKKPLRSFARYVSAQAKRWTTPGVDGYFHRLRNRYAQSLVQKLARFANKPNTYSWVARERVLVQSMGPMLDQHLVVEADAMLLDDDFLSEVVRPCLNGMEPEAAIQSYYDILAHRADLIEHGRPYFDARNDRVESIAILSDLTLDALRKTRVEPASRDHAIKIMGILEPLLVRTLAISYCHFCDVFCSMLDDEDEDVRHLAFSILYQQLWRNLELADQHTSESCHDLAALVGFMAKARHDNNLKHFLDACDLVICLATLPSLTSADYTQMRTDLRDTLHHLASFFETPLWRNDPRLLYSIARIAPHLVTLEKKFPRVFEDAFLDVFADVVEHARQLNTNTYGNWEDKLIVLEVSLRDLRTLRQGEGSSTAGSFDEGGRPSFMRRSPLMLPDP
ncbi:hypothetical protein BN946_scf184950.g4 [Trametes cinnabarina]|uniref:DUF6535 domain-containing protein n=1 Tax=Pycnoporus cinnabarinus TaxID=5643 RepID=A0A060SVQ8_PYCCI|nr:hypothetical protein BN946_scf184950.g4 [Trametes cinnabarina]